MRNFIKNYCDLSFSVLFFRLFASTREALRTIFPQASNEDIDKYDKQLEKVDCFDLVLIISLNYSWVYQHCIEDYQNVMYAFATNGLEQDNRRDENSLCIFHFKTFTELYTVRRNIRDLYPYAFGNIYTQTVPIGTAWIYVKSEKCKNDFAEDDSFFKE